MSGRDSGQRLQCEMKHEGKRAWEVLRRGRAYENSMTRGIVESALMLTIEWVLR